MPLIQSALQDAANKVPELFSPQARLLMAEEIVTAYLAAAGVTVPPMNSTERDLVERLRAIANHNWGMSFLAHMPDTAAEAADALASIRAERDMAERAAVEAAIPLEALLMAGQGPLSDAVWDGVRNGVGHVRSMLKARAARAIAGEQKNDA